MKVLVKKGETLFEALRKQNIRLNASCGGKGICGGCRVEVEKFGKVKACQFKIPGSHEVSVPKSLEFQAVGIMEGQTSFPDWKEEAGWDNSPVIAVDLGTTTVAMMGFYRGRQTLSSFTNPQRQYGADVMSRILQANSGKLKELSEIIRLELEEKCKELAEELEPSCRKVRVVIAGNTTMLHLLFGMDCRGLGEAPFSPVTLEKEEETWSFKDRNGNSYDYSIIALPGISAFVGADIVSGIYGLSLHKRTDRTLFIDLGTNGELVLADHGALYTASTAAGPAFEGNELAAELFGAGIIKVLHRMKESKSIDPTGMLAEEYFETGFPVPLEDGRSLRFTQEIIREIQMAKAAIRAGIEVLLKEAKLKADQVDEVILAGGMGYFVDPADAVGIGLLPEKFLQKTKAAGNTSLLGAVRYAKEEKRSADAEMKELSKGAKDIILADNPDFSQYYIEYMNF